MDSRYDKRVRVGHETTIDLSISFRIIDFCRSRRQIAWLEFRSGESVFVSLERTAATVDFVSPVFGGNPTLLHVPFPWPLDGSDHIQPGIDAIDGRSTDDRRTIDGRSASMSLPQVCAFRLITISPHNWRVQRSSSRNFLFYCSPIRSPTNGSTFPVTHRYLSSIHQTCNIQTLQHFHCFYFKPASSNLLPLCFVFFWKYQSSTVIHSPASTWNVARTSCTRVVKQKIQCACTRAHTRIHRTQTQGWNGHEHVGETETRSTLAYTRIIRSDSSNRLRK